MRRTIPAAALGALALAFGAGCGTYPKGCQEEKPLTEPWLSWKVPTGGGRVCASSDRMATIMVLRGDVEARRAELERALVAGGFTKGACSGETCRFTKDDQLVTASTKLVEQEGATRVVQTHLLRMHRAMEKRPKEE